MRAGLITFLLLLGACSAERGELPSPHARELLWEIQEAFDRQLYTQALTLLDSVVVLAPDYPRVHFLRGEVLSTLYRFDEAEVAFSKVLEIDPTYPGADFRKGNNAFFLGNNRQALELYQMEVNTLGSAADSAVISTVWSQIGRVYARLGVKDSARTAFVKAVEFDQSNDQAWKWMAEMSEEDGNLEQAMTEIMQAVAVVPNNADYQYMVGALHYRNGEYALAIDPLILAIELAPWHAGAHYNLGRSLVALGRQDEGQHYLELTDSLQALDADIVLAHFAVRTNPEDRDQWIVLGLLYEQAGKQREAAEAFRIARQLNELK